MACSSGPGRSVVRLLHRAHLSHPAVPTGVRHRGAETALAPGVRVRAADDGHRHDRALRGFGPREYRDHRQAQRRRHILRRQPSQDIHHRRCDGRPDPDGLPHRRSTPTTVVPDCRFSACRPTPKGSRWAAPSTRSGLHQQDTVELSCTDVRVPAENLLGIEGEAFSYLTHNLPQERLSIALNSVAHAEAAILHATNYVASGRCSASRWRRSRTRSSCLPNAPPRRGARVFVDHALELLDQG